MEDSQADEYSYMTQNLSGTLALTVPAIWNTTAFFLGRLSGVGALVATGADIVLVLQTAAWNGFLTESSHLISQRPRPFVYADPVNRGKDPAHYTSFYSGHTSFTAAATLITLLILLYRNAHWSFLVFSAMSFESLTLATGFFRVLAGRHFLTDVTCGAIAGCSVAFAVWYFTRQSSVEETEKLALSRTDRGPEAVRNSDPHSAASVLPEFPQTESD